ncbi:acetyltransferase [Dyadobacter aurulentus]|uniref:acetyltransferase n=1 Tax=Dyadobacter sp. UC 10 TaxID=2605428 RepID=UPI0011F3B8D0|nr:acetyltransferase [Dyadobacter sp. UC 10]KAA0990253.1 acetyltransferase [Dyadobacter sp. UC 10]
MLIYGAGGHAKVIFRMLIDAGLAVETVFDDQFSTRLFDRNSISYSSEIFNDKKLIIAIGDNFARRAVAGKVSHGFGQLVHKSALIDSTVRAGQGTVIFQQAIIQTDARIGEHVIINTGAIIEHECELKDFVHVAPRVTICGNVKVDENTLLGAGCIILPNISIGKNCIVGAGSVVTKSISDNTTVAGNPARILTL